MSLRRCRYALWDLGSTAGQPEKRSLGLAVCDWAEAMIRDDIKAAIITAMKGGEKETTATLRLASAAIKNRDIEARTGAAPKDDDALVTAVLQKMIKQRRESADIYRKNDREERAAAEEAEIAVIERFLPRQLNDEEAQAQIR